METTQKYSIILSITVVYFLAHPTLLLARESRLFPINVDEDHPGEKLYIVHVQRPAGGAKFRSFKDRSDWYLSFLANSTLDSGKPRMVYMYRHAISGFAARLTNEEVKAMEKLEGFVLAHQERELTAFTTYTPQLLGLTTWDGLWPDSFMGQGQIIGVIDSGIKPTHPSFRSVGVAPPPIKWNGRCYWGNPICNNKLIGAASFKHGIPSSPEDKLGHGTHVAGIAAGNFVDDAGLLGQALGTSAGLAPKAHLAIYKVLHQKRKVNKLMAATGDVLKGIDEAIRNHVDVLSMSLGDTTNVTLFDSSVDVGSYAAVTKGIVPVAAAGNYGPFKSIIRNDSPWVLTVGAANTDRRIAVTVKDGAGNEYDGESAYQPEGYVPQQLPLVFLGDTMECTNGSLDKFDVIGKIVFCGPGTNDLIEKGEVVKAAGGAGMIIFSDYTWVQPHVIPMAHLRIDVAKKLYKYYQQNDPNATAAFIFKGTQYGARPSPTVAVFSSRGPSLVNGNIIKPDVIAPGVNILSAWPFAEGPVNSTTKNFHFLPGTSMACPHVSGIVALLRNNHPSWSPAAIKSALMTTAKAVDVEGNPIKDDYDGKAAGAYGMGAGHINPVAANDPGLVYDIQPHDYIAYLCGSGFSDRQVSAIVRGLISCSRVQSFPADQLNYPSIALYLSAGASRTVNRTVTNVGDPDSEYTVQFDEPEGVAMDVDPPTLKFSRVDEKQSYRVTFSLKSGFSPVTDQHSEGQLAWSSGIYYARSPIVVTFQ